MRNASNKLQWKTQHFIQHIVTVFGPPELRFVNSGSNKE